MYTYEYLDSGVLNLVLKHFPKWRNFDDDILLLVEFDDFVLKRH